MRVVEEREIRIDVCGAEFGLSMLTWMYILSGSSKGFEPQGQPGDCHPAGVWVAATRGPLREVRRR